MNWTVIKFILLLFFSLSVHLIIAQSGCTDPQAINFNENALENDGSCLYPATDYQLMELNVLPEILVECSGIEFFNSNLWIHNDAGNEDKIYRIDSVTGEILQSIIIATADNLDWEDFAESDTYLFIGDFGNNPGNRTDLAIHRINKNDLNSVVVNADKIEFQYGDQTDFSNNQNNNDFDCEAFIFYNDSLHLFTKNWVNNQTKHYVIPNEPGTQIAQLRETFNVGGLITSADINEKDEIVLLGYTEDLGFNFMWLLFDFKDSYFFSGNKRKIALGHSSQNSQTEGITFSENGNGFICAEEFYAFGQLISPQKLLAFSTAQWTNPITAIRKNPFRGLINVFPNPFGETFQIDNPVRKKVSWFLYNEIGQILTLGNSVDSMIEISIPDQAPGYYFLSVIIEGQSHTYPMIGY